MEASMRNIASVSSSFALGTATPMTNNLMRIWFSESVIRGRMRRDLYDWYVINALSFQLGAEKHHWNREATAEVGS